METVTSPDGTPIAYHRSGTGAPLILVPGTRAANPAAWTAVVPTLEQHFTVYAVDRRGRGESGDGPGYAIEREFEDIAAVADSVGEPANLLGTPLVPCAPSKLRCSLGTLAGSSCMSHGSLAQEYRLIRKASSSGSKRFWMWVIERAC